MCRNSAWYTFTKNLATNIDINTNDVRLLVSKDAMKTANTVTHFQNVKVLIFVKEITLKFVS